MLGIAIHCIQHSQAMLERGVCELAHSFFHMEMKQGLAQISINSFFSWLKLFEQVKFLMDVSWFLHPYTCMVVGPVDIQLI